ALAAMAILAVLFQFVPREHEVTDFFQETAGSAPATAPHVKAGFGPAGRLLGLRPRPRASNAGEAEMARAAAQDEAPQ
ncbi:hypothetical protein AB0F20_27155, partial [Streptomyces goshikiensis]|uniref:hypothetical protein n=1 Tax=Streptomyces goshikiensis TaxID=1942 RepID=UPI0034033FDD